MVNHTIFDKSSTKQCKVFAIPTHAHSLHECCYECNSTCKCGGGEGHVEVPYTLRNPGKNTAGQAKPAWDNIALLVLNDATQGPS